jgi:hypothetical protein
MKAKLVRTGLRLLGPLLFVLVIARLRDRAALVSLLQSAEAWPLVLAVLLNFVNIHLKVVRWDVFLKTRGIVYPLRRAWGAFVSSLYVGMLTPGRVGDVLRVHYLRADLGVPYAEGLASVVIDRLCDLYVLVGFVAVGVVRYGDVLAGKLAWITWFGLGAPALVPLALLVPGIADRAAASIYRRLSKTTSEEGEKGAFSLFLEALRAHVGRRLLVTIPITVLTFVVTYLQGYLLARALHLGVSFFDATCLLAIANLLGLLPISISGIGVRELFFSRIFPALGLAESAGVTFGLLVFGVIYVAIAAIGFVGWQLAPPPDAGRRLDMERLAK